MAGVISHTMAEALRGMEDGNTMNDHECILCLFPDSPCLDSLDPTEDTGPLPPESAPVAEELDSIVRAVVARSPELAAGFRPSRR